MTWIAAPLESPTAGEPALAGAGAARVESLGIAAGGVTSSTTSAPLPTRYVWRRAITGPRCTESTDTSRGDDCAPPGWPVTTTSDNCTALPSAMRRASALDDRASAARDAESAVLMASAAMATFMSVADFFADAACCRSSRANDLTCG